MFLAVGSSMSRYVATESNSYAVGIEYHLYDNGIWKRLWSIDRDGPLPSEYVISNDLPILMIVNE